MLALRLANKTGRGLIAILMVVACTSSPPTPSTSPTTVTPTTSIVVTSTSGPATTTSTSTIPELMDLHVEVVVPPAAEEHGWSEVLFIPYGSETGELGTSGVWGSGLPVSRDLSGTWWVSDLHKGRVVGFSEDASLVREIPLDSHDGLLGVFVLDDGRLVGMTARYRLTIVRGDAVEYWDLSDIETAPSLLQLIDANGSVVFGRLPTGSSRFEVDVAAEEPAFSPVDFFRTRAGNRYSVFTRPKLVSVALPDAPQPVVLRFTMTGESGEEVFILWEAVGGSDGDIHLLLYGYPLNNESVQLSVYLHIGHDGELLLVEPTPNPFGERDPGDPSHLGFDPVAERPYIAVDDVDGLRIWRLEGRGT